MIRHTRALAIRQKAARGDLQTLFRRLSDDLRGLLARRSVADGDLAVAQLREIRAAAGAVILSVFVGPDGREAYTPDHRPLSPMAELLNRHIARMTAEVVLAHTRWLRRRAAPDVLAWLQRPRPLQELIEPLFAGNPLAQYEHSHEWLDSRGYTLSDRIWQTGEQTRRKLDLLLTEGIRQGDSAVTIADRIDGFLHPTRRNIRTRRPYGIDGSFDARRLVRSEITLAHSRASQISARLNPYVGGMDWRLSPQHPRIDICDRLATIGMSGERLREPYPPDTAPLPVQDSHPQCLCTSAPVLGDVAAINEQLRQRMDVQPASNPANPARFLKDLLEETLFSSLVMQIRRGEVEAQGLALDVAFGLAINRIEL